MLRLQSRPAQQQYRRDVGGHRACHADHRGDGRHLPHPRGDRGGLEIFHPRIRRHRARPVRHHFDLYGGGASHRRRHSTPWCGPTSWPTPSRSHPAMLNLAFVFLLLGYGTKVGLFPLHAWLPDAHAEGPTPITAVLSGLLLNVALYALLRCKMLLAGNPEALAPGPLMIAMGLGLAPVRRLHAVPPARHQTLFAYSSIEHMGIVTFAFGSAARSPTSPVCCTCPAFADQVGHLLRRRRHLPGQGHAEDRRHGRLDLDQSRARLGPGDRRRRHRRTAAARHLHQRIPGGELHLRARAAVSRYRSWSGSSSRIGALFLRLNSIAFGEPRAPTTRPGALMFRCSHISPSCLSAGIYLPPPLVAWSQTVARLLG